ncbi:MAG TPA: hypothetical protein VE135_10695 [Pyrinomonadaceae bacterium]|nr:hypothetical protein [Pyrinomonadaceae bacterium]
MQRPATFALVAFGLLLVGLLACYLPARAPREWIRWWPYGTNDVRTEFEI